MPGFDREKAVTAVLRLGYSDRQLLAELSGLLAFDESGYLAQARPYLSPSEIEDLIRRGHFAGAHSFDHPLLSELTLPEIVEEVRRSLDDISSRFSLPVKLFAFPFSDYGVQAGTVCSLFNSGADALFGSAGMKNERDIRHFQRIPFEKTAAPASVILKTEYLYYLLKAPFGKNLQKR